MWLHRSCLFTSLAFALLAYAQNAPRNSSAAAKPQATSEPAPVILDGWGRPALDALKPGEKPGPAPRHDISGIWEPARGPGDGIQPAGAHEMPRDGKPEHDPPYSPAGLAAQKSNKSLYGYGSVIMALSNDPRNICDPVGFPRADLYQIRHTKIMQDAQSVVILYEFEHRFRVIWTDGRELPKEVPEPRYYGYSVGKWEDDTTLVVDTIGTMGNEKAWLDEGGHPTSEALHVQERFHRANNNLLELTVTIDDPKMYTKPWVGMNKFPMRLQPPDYDLVEQMCIPSEQDQYYKDYGDPASGTKRER